MEVGMLTVPFGNESFETVLDFAEQSDIPCLELAVGPGNAHLDLNSFTKSKANKMNAALKERDLRITALAFYNPTYNDPKQSKSVQKYMLKTIDAAALLGVKTVCMLACFPLEGKSKIETIQTYLPKFFKPLLTRAKAKGIRIALENWFATCLQGLDTFEALFQSIPDPLLGLNYDPSHLYHQECDHLAPVSLYADRIFHTHAKDTLVDRAKRAKVGIYGQGWWRYVIPGFGNLDWGEFVSHLRDNGYDDVMSIEHEDRSQGREAGFMRGAWYLEQFC